MGIIVNGPSWGDVMSALGDNQEEVTKPGGYIPDIRIVKSVKYERGVGISEGGMNATAYDLEAFTGRWWVVHRLRIQVWGNIYDVKGIKTIPSIDLVGNGIVKVIGNSVIRGTNLV